MRINIILRSLQKSARREFEYHYRISMQSFLYSILNDSPFDEVKQIHDTEDKVSPFCFSDIRGKFGPEGNLYDNPELCSDPKKDRYQIIISTPKKEVGMTLLMKFNELIREKPELNLKMSRFLIEEVTPQQIQIHSGDILCSDTPIVLSNFEKSEGVPRYVLFGEHRVLAKNCVEDPKLFISALEKNLARKIIKLGIKETSIVSNFEITRMEKHWKATIPLFELQNGKPYFVIGSRVRIKLKEDCLRESIEAINTLFDTGFGAYNSYGMGFMMKEVHKHA